MPRPSSRIGLLTGAVGVGKTTVAGRVVDLARQRGLICGGLLTPALVGRRGQKIGIWGVDVSSGERRLLARIGEDLGGPAIGPYSFSAAALAWAVSVLEAALPPPPPVSLRRCDLLLVDEIGKLELWHGAGLAPILPRLAAGEAPRALVVVRDFLLDELQARLGAIEPIVFLVSEQNREELPVHILHNLMMSDT